MRAVRRQVSDLAHRHSDSLNEFRNPDRPWYFISLEDRGDRRTRQSPLSHLTTTASCLESALEAGDAIDDIISTLEQFAVAALARPADRWVSDGSAPVYCRVRTLPVVLENIPQASTGQRRRLIRQHMNFVWRRVNANPPQQGIFEDVDGSDYPPNAFQTYWALRMLAGQPSDDFDESRSIVLLWLRSTLGTQTALCSTGSPHADASQLAWTIAALLRFSSDDQLRSPRLRDLFRAGLDAFFALQRENGSWGLYSPIFHYRSAGNAYCYSFETLAELVNTALVGDGVRRQLADTLLRPYVSHLIRAFKFCDSTKESLSVNGDRTVGWCSGHHPHRTRPEAWATASVFLFLQRFRRLIGQWVDQDAASRLRIVPTVSRVEGADLLRSRGDTWTAAGTWNVGRQLSTLFTNPALARQSAENTDRDPDLKLIDSIQCRSAILYGPPGTSKTTLVQAVAAVIGWRYVEIHASDFLSKGLDQVPARADEIFTDLMELDRTVILFDEIDGLIHERKASDSDPLGRFLTTSMLPKLAKLWEQRRVLYFVATNDVTGTDSAIARSQRFDAVLYVAPPSLDAKRQRLTRLTGRPVRCSLQQVETALASHQPLARFAMVRYDQLDELASRLSVGTDSPIGVRELTDALETFPPDPGELEEGCQQVIDERRRARIDHRMVRVVRRVDGVQLPRPETAWPGTIEARTRPPSPFVRLPQSGATETRWAETTRRTLQLFFGPE